MVDSSFLPFPVALDTIAPPPPSFVAVDPVFNYPPDPNLQGLPPTPYNLVETIYNLRKLIPSNWFADTDNVLNAILATHAASINDNQVRLDWSAKQSRVRSATGIWLDMYAEEFFGVGGWMYRWPNESDANYRQRILFELMAPRGTRTALKDVMAFWMGRTPQIVELWSTADCGAYDTGGIFYDMIGCWGSTDDPYTVFLTGERAGVIAMQTWNDETIDDFNIQMPGILNGTPVTNTNFVYGGWDEGLFYYNDGDVNQSYVSDRMVYDEINRTIPAGITAFVHLTDSQQLSNDPNAVQFALLDYNFQLDKSEMASDDHVQTVAGVDQPLLGISFILGTSVLGNITGGTNAVPIHGFVASYLDINFVLNQSVLALVEGTPSSLPPLYYGNPGILDSAILPFVVDQSVPL